MNKTNRSIPHRNITYKWYNRGDRICESSEFSGSTVYMY